MDVATISRYSPSITQGADVSLQAQPIFMCDCFLKETDAMQQVRGGPHAHMIMRVAEPKKRARDVATQIALHVPTVRLSDISGKLDIWDMVCALLPGAALMCLVGVTSLRDETKQTAAFTLLSGVDNNCMLVPWEDPYNVLTPQYLHRNEADDRVRLFWVCSRALRQTLFPKYSYLHSLGGPARPPTPQGFALNSLLLSRTVVMPAKVCVLACTTPEADRLDRCVEEYKAPVFGIRAGFSYPPFRDVLIGTDFIGDTDDDDDD